MAEIVDFGLQQHKIKMDSRYFENVLSVVAGDTGRRIEVQLLDTNGMVQDTTGLSLRLNAEIAGKATYTDATLVDATIGKYQLDISNGMFLAPGNWQFQWQITDSLGKKLHSFAFTGNVGINISEGGSQATNFYLNLEDLKAMQEDLVNGTIDSSILETNITEKLTNLETQYAPKLTEVTAQLAQTFKNSDTGVLSINAFTETDRAIIQGLEPGQINAVLGERNVKPENTSFLDYTAEEINFFDIGNVIEGGFLRALDATLTASTTWVSTNFITVGEGGTIKVGTSAGGTYNLTFFDVNKVFISGIAHVFSTTQREEKTFTAPPNTASFKIGVRTSEFATFFLGVDGANQIKDVRLNSEVGINVNDNSLEPEKMTFLGRKNTRRVNQFDKTKIINGGYHNNLGEYVASATVSSSHFIPIKSNDAIRVVSGIQGNTHITFWDASGNFIAGDVRVLYANQPSVFYTPFNPNITQFKIAIRNSEINSYMAIINDPFPSRYWTYDEMDYDIEVKNRMGKAINEVVDNKSTSDLYGKKWGIVGDSIPTIGYLANGNEYPALIANQYNLILNNLAIPGSLIAKSNKSGHATSHMCEKVLELDVDCDIVTVAGLVNDIRQNQLLGVMGGTDITTVYGALDLLCRNLYAKFPNKPKAIFTPLKYRGNEETMKPYLKALKEVANRYSIRVLDLNVISGLQPDIDAINMAYFANADGLHPNAAGHAIIATPVKHFLESLI